MTPEEVKRELRRFAYDPRYKVKGDRVPIAALARYAGLHRDTLLGIIYGFKKPGHKVMDLLPPVLEKILAGRLKFVRNGLHWDICETPPIDYAGAGQEASGAHKIIPLSKPALLDRVR